MQEDLRGLEGGRALSESPVEVLRQRIGGAVRGLLTGAERVDERALAGFAEPPGDPGLFGPDSVAWRVHGDIAGLIGGLRALLLQTLHPLAMAGVDQHSDYREDPWGRLHRTAAFIGATTFGSTATAHEAMAVVRAVHRGVQGTAPDGRPYSADDPDLLRWVHATEVDSFVKAVAAYGSTRLSGGDIDRYLDEMAVVAEGLGATAVPRSRADLRTYWADVRPELEAGPSARETARFLLRPPAPSWARPAYGVVTLAAIGLLPAFVRSGLGLPLPPGLDPVVVRPAARSLVRLLGWSLGPSPLLEAARARATGSLEP